MPQQSPLAISDKLHIWFPFCFAELSFGQQPGRKEIKREKKRKRKQNFIVIVHEVAMTYFYYKIYISIGNEVIR